MYSKIEKQLRWPGTVGAPRRKYLTIFCVVPLLSRVLTILFLTQKSDRRDDEHNPQWAPMKKWRTPRKTAHYAASRISHSITTTMPSHRSTPESPAQRPPDANLSLYAEFAYTANPSISQRPSSTTMELAIFVPLIQQLVRSANGLVHSERESCRRCQTRSSGQRLRRLANDGMEW